MRATTRDITCTLFCLSAVCFFRAGGTSEIHMEESKISASEDVLHLQSLTLFT